jgi:sec-independent protein translocase protein TatA
MFSSQDIILIGIIVIFLFGASKLPQIGSGVGQAIRNLKEGMADADEIEAPQKESSEKEEAKKKEGE